MGNCGTREENAVVAAHAQGIHLPVVGFSRAPPLLSLLVWISAAALRTPSNFDLGGLFLWSWALGSCLAAVCHKCSLFLLWRLLDQSVL
jgi:hypothetical protein